MYSTNCTSLDNSQMSLMAANSLNLTSSQYDRSKFKKGQINESPGFSPVLWTETELVTFATVSELQIKAQVLAGRQAHSIHCKETLQSLQ